MTKMENAILYDEILLLFTGNISVSWNELREKFGERTEAYFIRENKIIKKCCISFQRDPHVNRST